MEGTTNYLQTGIFLISVANLVVIVLLLLVFFVAISFRWNRDRSSTIVEDAGDQPGTAPSREPEV
jgi:hypothetical protein